jgi:hypothetical protein
MDQQKPTDNLWAIVELFGHAKIAGRISEVQKYGTTLLRVDIPAGTANPAFTRDFGGGAIYSITYVTESIARRAAEVMSPLPVTVYGVIAPERQLSLPEVEFVPDDESLFPPDGDLEQDRYND